MMENKSIDRRYDIETDLMALVLNKNEIIDLLQIKPKYLITKEYETLLEQCIACYNKMKYIEPKEMIMMDKNFNIDLYMEIMLNALYYQSSWKERLDYCQETILKYYKEDVIEQLNEKLKNKDITYDDFMEKMKKIDTIQLQEKTEQLTAKELLENINEENTRIILNNFPKLSDTLKLTEGDFLIIGATTGVGKSALMLNLMNDLMNDYQCIYFNMEMAKSTIYKRIISINADIPVNSITNPSDYQNKLLNEAIKKIDNAKLIIEHKANDIKKIKALITKVKSKDKHTILFIDHLGLTKVDDKKSIYEQATEIAKQLRQICLEYDCTIISASQLNRGAYNSEELTLNMLKDSGELENSASKVILLYTEKDQNKELPQLKMNVDVAKNRDGITGIIKMNYDKTKQVFKEMNNYV